jgi:glycosyltransferase involved in cell wall biosynthesis
MVKANPLVSVVIPNYNHAIFLEERIQSVLNQTYTNYEIIILDDNSTDESLNIINKFRNNPKVSKIIINDHNGKSPFKQWYKGISHANGDIIWLAESDDTCEPEFLATLVPIYLMNNCVFAFARSKYIDENGKMLGVTQKKCKSSGTWSGKKCIFKYLSARCFVVNASSAIFSKAKALEINDQFVSFKSSGDWLFWIEMAEIGNVSFVSDTLNMYRIYSGNTTKKTSETGIMDIENHKIYNYLLSRNLLSKYKAFSIKKRALYKVKYKRSYDKAIKDDILQMWNPNFAYRSITLMSRIFHLVANKSK